MRETFPSLPISNDQLTFLTALLMVYQQYLQRKSPLSVTHKRTLRVLSALLQRFYALFTPRATPTPLLLLEEEVAIIKEALAVTQQVLATKPPFAGRDQELQRLTEMKTLIEQTFPLTHD
ncbi:MAG: hypothetical protein ACRDHZ_05945 [Ktedonobacteraceae bacterium]